MVLSFTLQYCYFMVIAPSSAKEQPSTRSCQEEVSIFKAFWLQYGPRTFMRRARSVPKFRHNEICMDGRKVEWEHTDDKDSSDNQFIELMHVTEVRRWIFSVLLRVRYFVSYVCAILVNFRIVLLYKGWMTKPLVIYSSLWCYLICYHFKRNRNVRSTKHWTNFSSGESYEFTLAS